MALRDLSLKEQYRSDRDKLLEEFFIPCLQNCIEYDRAVEYASINNLAEFYFSLKNFLDNDVRLRFIIGRMLRTADLNILSKLFSKKNGKIHLPQNSFKQKYSSLIEMINTNKLNIKIAIPNPEEGYGTFSEKIGIFHDKKDDTVAFTGTSNKTFDPQNRDFESIDVFTSWNDKSRVEMKIRDFENLWQNKTKNVTVYDVEYALKNNLLNYSTEWVLNT